MIEHRLCVREINKNTVYVYNSKKDKEANHQFLFLEQKRIEKNWHQKKQRMVQKCTAEITLKECKVRPGHTAGRTGNTCGVINETDAACPEEFREKADSDEDSQKHEDQHYIFVRPLRFLPGIRNSFHDVFSQNK